MSSYCRSKRLPVNPKKKSVQSAVQSAATPPSLQYNFGDSPLPPQWKQCVVDKLNAIPEVFAKHDIDFGLTDKVKHQIKLSDL